MKDKYDTVTHDFVDDLEDNIEHQVYVTMSEISSASEMGDKCLMQSISALSPFVFNHLLRAVLVRRYHEGDN